MIKKGFTLIELLAVIVILAIIALIATPVILGVVEKAHEGAAKSGGIGYIKAVENQIAINAVDTSKENIVDGNYTVSELGLKGVSVKGNGPTSGNVTITKGEVTACSLVIDKYTVTCLGNGKVQIGKEVEEKLEGTEISVVAQNLLDTNTTYGNYTYMGGTYLKGVQANNYVWYNGFLWRIMGLNENGTVRLITEENVSSLEYGAIYGALLYATNEGYINNWLNDYFLSNLDSSKTDIITKSEWCINVTESSSKRNNCNGGSIFEANIGLITLDEYNLSGLSASTSNYYLNNQQTFWTLTPANEIGAWYASAANITNRYASTILGIRPVINVSAESIITSGNGTLKDAYMLNQTNKSKTGKLNEKASSGEYASLDGKIYRIVSKEENGTKLIYDGYYEETPGTPYTIAYGDNDIFTTTSGIGQKLNNEVLTWLGASNKIIESNWYQASGFDHEVPYTTILDDKTNPIKAKVGLIRVGEILSGQSASILTQKYNQESDKSNLINYWTMNKYTRELYNYSINSDGYGSFYSITNEYGIRPVIVVSTNTMITGGNGTLQSPYIIE